MPMTTAISMAHNNNNNVDDDYLQVVPTNNNTEDHLATCHSNPMNGQQTLNDFGRNGPHCRSCSCARIELDTFDSSNAIAMAQQTYNDPLGSGHKPKSQVFQVENSQQVACELQNGPPTLGLSENDNTNSSKELANIAILRNNQPKTIAYMNSVAQNCGEIWSKTSTSKPKISTFSVTCQPKVMYAIGYANVAANCDQNSNNCNMKSKQD